MTLSEKMLFCVCLFCKVVQKHCLGEVGKYTILQLPKIYVIFLPKIIEIRKCLFKLQLKMSGVFFRHSVVSSRCLVHATKRLLLPLGCQVKYRTLKLYYRQAPERLL